MCLLNYKIWKQLSYKNYKNKNSSIHLQYQAFKVDKTLVIMPKKIQKKIK